MHGGGKGVVRTLAGVHVVIGADQLADAKIGAQQLRCAICQNLIYVHVGLGARSCLPDHQWELVFHNAGKDLVAAPDDGVHFFRGQNFQLAVGQRGCFFDQRVGVHEFPRHLLAADGEIFQAALRLRAPIAVFRHQNRTHCVLLFPVLIHATADSFLARDAHHPANLPGPG